MFTLTPVKIVTEVFSKHITTVTRSGIAHGNNFIRVNGRPVATGEFGGSAPQISFIPPQILLCPEKFVLNI